MKRILSVLLALVMIVGMLPMTLLTASAAETEIVFTLGEDGTATHADGSSNSTYSKTVNGYTLSLTDGTNMFTGARDAKGNGCIKLGTSKKVGGFSFTVPGDVTQVVIYAAKYKTNTTSFTVNNTTYSLTNASNDGLYEEITVDTSSTKTITVTTTFSGCRAMVNSIKWVVSASDCDHTTELQNIVAVSCTADGYTGDEVCTACGMTINGGSVIPMTGHSFADGVCTVCQLKQDSISTYQLTSATDVVEGEYIIGIDKSGTYPTVNLATNVCSEDWTVDTSDNIANNDIISADLFSDEVQTFDLTGNNTDGFTVSYDNGDEIVYLGYTDINTNRKLAFSAEYSNVLWTVAADDNGKTYLLNTVTDDSGTVDYYIVSANAGDIRAYKWDSGEVTSKVYNTLYFFKKVSTAQDQCVHEFGEWTVTEAVTCTTNGMREHTCGLCDLTESEYIEKLGHTVVDGVCSTCHETIYTLATTLADNDKVIIYYVAGGLAMTATASGNKLTGVAGTVTDGQLIYADAMAALTVEYVDDTNFYLISADGKYLTSGATGNSLTLADAPTIYSNWYLKVADEAEGIVYIKNTNATYNTKAQDMEYYNGFTTYSTNTGSAYEMQLYVQTGTAACEHTWSDWTLETASSCTTLGVNVRTCTTEGGCGHTQRSAIDMLGHSYTLGDTAVCDNCDASLSLSTIETVKGFTDTNTLYYFEGVVTYIKGKNVYIEDSTGGVLVYFTSDPSDIALGDKIRVCDTMKKYNGLIETPGTTTGEYYVVSQGNALPSQTVTIADLLADTSNEYLAERVVIENVTVGTINTSGNTALTDANGNSINIYKVSGLSEDINENDTVTVTAIVSTYNAYQLLINPGTAATDVVKIENAAVYDGETEVNTYATVEAAYAAATEGQYIKLLANCETDLTLNKDLYIDVNGFGIEGEVVTGNYKIYGIDSATDNYTASNGYLGLTMNGGLAEVSTEADKYLMTEGDNGWTFHAYAAKLTHVSLDAYNDALGYKAQLFGDEVVMEHVTGFGFNLWVDGGTAKEYGKTYEAGEFETGTVLTLRLKNIMAADGGEMNINANAFVTFDESDGKITGAEHTTTMKDVVETIETMIENGTATYTAEQIKTVQDMITKYESKMTGWNIDAIKAWTAPTTEA